MARLRLIKESSSKEADEEDLGGQMSFLEHLDELRKRLIRCMAFVLLASMVAWFLSDRIYNFLAYPVQKALAEAQQRKVTLGGQNGQLTAARLNSLSLNDKVRFVFPDKVRLGSTPIPPGTSVA